jgi:hypothetical protein
MVVDHEGLELHMVIACMTASDVPQDRGIALGIVAPRWKIIGDKYIFFGGR